MHFANLLIGGLLLLGADAQQQQINLGTAAPFGVLAATTITNTGLTVVNGQLGVFPGTAITGFPPGIAGDIHAGDAAARQAQADATVAYNRAAGLASTRSLTGQDLGGMVLPPGVYTFTSSAQLTGTLTLDAQGNPNAQFVFQIGSTLTTASLSSVVLINGGDPCNVFWQVGSSATIGTGTLFAGNILALTSITVTTGSSNNGGLFALNAAVTLDTARIRSCQGNVITSSSSSISPSTTATITTPPATSTITSTVTVTVTKTRRPSTVTVTSTATNTLTKTKTKTVSTHYTTLTSTRTRTYTSTYTTTRPTPKCKTNHKNDKRAPSKTTKTVYHTVTHTEDGGAPTTVTVGGEGQRYKTVKTGYTSTATHYTSTKVTKHTTLTVTPPCTTRRALRFARD